MYISCFRNVATNRQSELFIENEISAGDALVSRASTRRIRDLHLLVRSSSLAQTLQISLGPTESAEVLPRTQRPL